MRILFIVALISLGMLRDVTLAASPAVAAAMAKGDAFDRQLKTQESLDAYLEAEKAGGRGAELYRKISREYALSMVDTDSKATKRELGDKAVSYARRAVEADPDDAEANLALAICYGRLAPLLDNKTKIAYSKLVKDYAEKAVALDSSNDYAYHVLGAWNYEITSLSPFLRTMVKLIYGALPTASYDAAAGYFEKAVKLAPQRVSHHIELGRTYAAMGKNDLARAELTKGLKLPSREKDDEESKASAREALKKL